MLKLMDAAQCGLVTLGMFVLMIACACVTLFIIDVISKIMAHIGLKDKDLPEWEVDLLKTIKKEGILSLLNKYIENKFNI